MTTRSTNLFYDTTLSGTNFLVLGPSAFVFCIHAMHGRVSHKRIRSLWPWSLQGQIIVFFTEHIQCAYVLERDRVAYELYSHLELWPQGQIIVSLSSVELFFILRWITCVPTYFVYVLGHDGVWHIRIGSLWPWTLTTRSNNYY